MLLHRERVPFGMGSRINIDLIYTHKREPQVPASCILFLSLFCFVSFVFLFSFFFYSYSLSTPSLLPHGFRSSRHPDRLSWKSFYFCQLRVICPLSLSPCLCVSSSCYIVLIRAKVPSHMTSATTRGIQCITAHSYHVRLVRRGHWTRCDASRTGWMCCKFSPYVNVPLEPFPKKDNNSSVKPSTLCVPMSSRERRSCYTLLTSSTPDVCKEGLS